MSNFNLDSNTIHFTVNTHDPTLAGNPAADADSVPTFRVYENQFTTAILTGSMAKLDDANTIGYYAAYIVTSTANGFTDGNSYNVYVIATVNGITSTTKFFFTVGIDQRNSKLLKYVRLLARSDAAPNLDHPNEWAEINANLGNGAGAYLNTSHAIQAILNHGDAAWTTGSGLATTVSSGEVSSTRLNAYKGSAKSWAFTVVDEAGAAIDLSSKTVKLVVESQDGADAFVVTGIVSGAGNNIVTAATTSAHHATAGQYQWALKNTTDDGVLLGHGVYHIHDAATEGA